ncbi:CHAT domain-containing protein [Streptacidiphilus sp. P02-A3a]|uniref:CHAT domain-containing protein n=1 Tax=Streptacidiphilus sp. P02-A3a TaxID=2704468 RepID=UPI0015FBCE3C|nr:CHAT domain-containing protein [Streptacidiphilus sp. P02-A3a]QMU69608.1 CHAT domain-containing protein [Streptacidiphilus sp. P02-A3a]
MAFALAGHGDVHRARQCLEQAAARTEDPRILFDIGAFHQQRLGDDERALVCYRRAAGAGSVDAMNNLGVLLKNRGQQVEAEVWLRRAAVTGDQDAAGNLAGLLLLRGRRTEAAPWLERAATGGTPDAMATLALYLLQDGREQAARTWFGRAAATGHQGAAAFLRRLDSQDHAPADRPQHTTPPVPGPAREDDAPVRIDLQDLLGSAENAQRAYERHGNPEVLELALSLVEMVTSGSGPARGSKSEALRLRGVLLRLRYERTRDRADLDAAVTAGRAALADAGAHGAGRANRLSSLCASLQEVFVLTGDTSVIEEAVSLSREALEEVSADPGFPHRAALLGNLSNALLRLSRADGRPQTVAEAVVAGREAVQATADGDPALAGLLLNLGTALVFQAGTSNSLVALDEAIRCYRRGLALLPEGHPRIGAVRSMVEQALRAQEDLRRSTTGTPAPAPADVSVDELMHAADTEYAEYESTGDLTRLDAADAGYRAVLDAATDDSGIRDGLIGLGLVRWSRTEHNGDAAELDQAIELFQAAAARGDQSAPEALIARSNLGGVLLLRATRTAAEDDLRESVRLAREVLDAIAPDSVRRAGRLDTLGMRLLSLYRTNNDSGTLEEAEGFTRAALTDSGRTGEPSPSITANLAEVLKEVHVRYPHTSRGTAALNEAVELIRAAVAATPQGHLLRPRLQGNLAAALLQRHSHQQDADQADPDLAEAAEALDTAIATTPEGHPNLIERTSLLAHIRHLRYQRTGGAADALAAVQAAEAALRATPRGHQLRSGALIQLGRALTGQYLASDNIPALTSAVACFQQATADPYAPASRRVEAARLGGYALIKLESWPEAATCFTAAVELLPRLAPRALSQADREHQLSRISGLASDAAACALQAGDPPLAVRLLEQGRAVLLSQALDARTDISELCSRHPGLADRFDALRDALDPREHRTASNTRQPAAEPRALTAQWDELIATIRRQPGLQDFLAPPDLDELLPRITRHGSVSIVNSSYLRSDALLLTADGIRLVPLPDLRQDEVSRHAGALPGLIGTAFHDPSVLARRDAQRDVSAVLRWLWDTTAEPVLSALGLTRAPAPGDTWPRLWWMPTGQLAALPLHAAGRHPRSAADNAGTHMGTAADPDRSATVPDRVVPSYALTLRALARAHQRSTAGNPVPQGPLLVAMPTTPGPVADLPHVRAETDAVTGRLPGIRLLTGDQAVQRTVLAELPRYRWAHFSCHATSTPDQPSAGRILLHDHATEPLTTADIARLDLSQAELVYLSACRTTHNRTDLPDEPVHITGSFHLAGYAHVIGTLWEVQDEAAARIAAAFYQAICLPHADAARSARALHASLRREHDLAPLLPSHWAAHLHVGI